MIALLIAVAIAFLAAAGLSALLEWERRRLRKGRRR
jgi:hypothetical protein